MAIALVGTIGVVSTSAFGGSVAPAFGSSENRTAGHLLVLWVTGHGSATLPTAPTGWSVSPNGHGQEAGTNGTCSVSVFYRIADGTEGSTVTVAAVSSTVLNAQLAEFSGNATSSVLDRAALGGSISTSPIVATAGSADTFPKSLVIAIAATAYGSAHANTAGSHTLNNGASANSTNNNASNVASHYDFAYGVTTGNSSADSDSYAFTTTNIADEASVLITFKPSNSVITKAQTSKVRVRATVTKTQTAKVRVQKVVTKTQTAIARVQATVTKAQTSKVRVQATVSKTQTAKSRIQKVLTKTQAAIARIQKTTTKTQTSTARVQKTRQATQPAVARVEATVQATQVSVGRLEKTLLVDQESRARIQIVATTSQTSTARIQIVATASQSSRARLGSLLTTIQTATARIKAPPHPGNPLWFDRPIGVGDFDRVGASGEGFQRPI